MRSPPFFMRNGTSGSNAPGAATDLPRTGAVPAAMKLVTIVLCLLFALSVRGLAATVTPDDVYNIVSFSEPAFSPDGTKLVAIKR